MPLLFLLLFPPFFPLLLRLESLFPFPFFFLPLLFLDFLLPAPLLLLPFFFLPLLFLDLLLQHLLGTLYVSLCVLLPPAAALPAPWLVRAFPWRLHTQPLS